MPETMTVRVIYPLQDGRIVLRLRDFGTRCDPARLQGRPLDCVQPGGLGIHLMRRAFTEIDYCLMEAGTELRLTKRLEG